MGNNNNFVNILLALTLLLLLTLFRVVEQFRLRETKMTVSYRFGLWFANSIVHLKLLLTQTVTLYLISITVLRIGEVGTAVVEPSI